MITWLMWWNSGLKNTRNVSACFYVTILSSCSVLEKKNNKFVWLCSALLRCLIMFELARSISNFRNMSHENQNTKHTHSPTPCNQFSNANIEFPIYFAYFSSNNLLHTNTNSTKILISNNKLRMNTKIIWKLFQFFLQTKRKTRWKKLKQNDKFSTQWFP